MGTVQKIAVWIFQNDLTLYKIHLIFSAQLKLAFIICSGLVKAREVLFIIQRQMQLPQI